MERKSSYDIIIIGAGPAGTTCALALKNSGLRVLLLDKAEFPRNKVCGDAIPGRAVSVFESVSPQDAGLFRSFPRKVFTGKSAIYVDNKHRVGINWVKEAYGCKREHFDQFLLDTVFKRFPEIHWLAGENIDFIERQDKTMVVGNQKTDRFYQAPIIVGCDGAQSVVNKRLTGTRVVHRHYVGSVRAYYTGIQNFDPNVTEVFILRKYLPGYFWIIPVSAEVANVGYGMLSSAIIRRKANLKKDFFAFMDEYNDLSLRFKNSELLGKVEGFGLPLGTRRVPISGDGFLLAGDAASLIDPTTGDGIGNAMLSGKLAAEQAIKAFAGNRFDAAGLYPYEQALFAKLGKELRRRTWMLRMATAMPGVVSAGAGLLSNEWVKKLARGMW